jgi:hypothetical protein
MPPASGDVARGHRQFPCAGHADHVDRVFVHAVADEGRARGGHQRIGDARVPAAGDDREARALRGAQVAFDVRHGGFLGGGEV